ncbi:Tripartite tricarboxylate transporter family receptor [Pseudodesulfovibrio hydrargyri]|uniref:Tripartite tricarboxylate transporter family receptor n=1 Tax=Pseudodesulfovibrio hydrargyri TaxID=2125990 RepID=A0A1J5MXZ2_9BACT|nr:tripartite tricarboxylate transporter substrate binding protein [Pseudodesulfovibrio hydrargyri]OIQ50700.1 Tripartite tricarboxylate transporter family receptor [Pseudodesulfovibrio hydrargyri]
MKSLWNLTVALAFILITFGSALAGYPEKDITYVVPFGPGGESDISARIQQANFRRLFGKSMVIQYKPGGGGAVGWSSLQQYPADGYTIMGTNLPHIVLKPLQKGNGFNLEDIINVYFFHYTPDAIVVPADSKFKTLADLVQAAKDNPGMITFAGTGSYSNNHFAKTRFDKIAEIKTTYIPFKTTGDAAMAMLGGQVAAHWGYTTVGIAQGDKVRLLAIAGETRHPLFPGVPTFKELGYDFVGGAYRGLALPKASNETTREEVSAMLDKLNHDQKFREQMVQAGFTMVDVPYDEIPAFLDKLKVNYYEVAKELKLIK